MVRTAIVAIVDPSTAVELAMAWRQRTMPYQMSLGSGESPAARLARAWCVCKLMLYDSERTEPSQNTAFQADEWARRGAG